MYEEKKTKDLSNKRECWKKQKIQETPQQGSDKKISIKYRFSQRNTRSHEILAIDMALFPSSSRPRSLMEQLLARKIEAAAQSVTGPGGVRLRRTDSLDSTSSIGSLGSLVLGDDVCRCDDCLLGIVDLYVISAEAAKKKVSQNNSLAITKDVSLTEIHMAIRRRREKTVEGNLNALTTAFWLTLNKIFG